MTTQPTGLSRPFHHRHAAAFAGAVVALIAGAIATYAAVQFWPEDGAAEPSTTRLAPSHAPTTAMEAAYSLELAAIAEANAILAATGVTQVGGPAPSVAAAAVEPTANALAEANSIRAVSGLGPVTAAEEQDRLRDALGLGSGLVP